MCASEIGLSSSPPAPPPKKKTTLALDNREKAKKKNLSLIFEDFQEMELKREQMRFHSNHRSGSLKC